MNQEICDSCHNSIIKAMSFNSEVETVYVDGINYRTQCFDVSKDKTFNRLKISDLTH